jgi:hypothetical protein
MYLALDLILHLLVLGVENATLLSQRKKVVADKEWNRRTCIKRYGRAGALRKRGAILAVHVWLDSILLADRLGACVIQGISMKRLLTSCRIIFPLILGAALLLEICPMENGSSS